MKEQLDLLNTDFAKKREEKSQQSAPGVPGGKKPNKGNMGMPGGKKPKRNAKDRFLLKYNLTLEKLTYNNRPTSEAIVIKANKFLEMNCVEKIGGIFYTKKEDIDQENPIKRETYICKPILGYNSTTYTMNIDKDRYHTWLSCNCQWCVTYERLCSHLLALTVLVTIPHPLKHNVKIISGVRQKGLREFKAGT